MTHTTHDARTQMRQGDIVSAAYRADRGIGAFNVVLLEHAEAIAAGAEQSGAPVVFQISENCVRYHGSLAPLLQATLDIAASVASGSLVHLDHAEDVDLVKEAVDLGIQSVMFDASRLDFARNVELTTQVATYCHDRGVLVEAELGEVGGKDGVHAPTARTDPDQARQYVEQTGVDWLAVAVGTSHAMTDRVARADRALITRLHEAVDVPLVLHGSSSLSDEELGGAVRAGITKINMSTHLNRVFSDAILECAVDGALPADPRRYMRVARDAVAHEVTRMQRVVNREI